MKQLQMPEGRLALEVYYIMPERTSVDGVTKTKGGIVITDALKKDSDLIEYKSHPWVAKVVSSGSRFFKDGDIVYLSAMTGVALQNNPQSYDFIIHDGRDLMVLPEVRVLCKDNALSLDDYKKL